MNIFSFAQNCGGFLIIFNKIFYYLLPNALWKLFKVLVILFIHYKALEYGVKSI